MFASWYYNIHTTLYRDNGIDVVNELYKRTKYLLSDFFFTESCTVSNLFNSFCMNLYSCQTWRFNNKKHLKAIYVTWRKCIRRIWKINSKTHNDLLHYINNCLPIYILLEKWYIKFKSQHSLHSRIALYSLYNGDTIILGEHTRYFMYTKCHIQIGIVLFII